MHGLAFALSGLASLGLVTAASLAADPILSLPAFSLKDGQILGRTLGYIGEATTGTAIVGIAFAPADPVSRREAELVLSVIGEVPSSGRLHLQGRLITVAQLAGVTDINAIYVTGGLAQGMNEISAAARRLHVPTIAANLTCVQSGGCAVGFSSEPTVQILVDHQTTEKAGVHFRQAFLMLVREK